MYIRRNKKSVSVIGLLLTRLEIFSWCNNGGLSSCQFTYSHENRNSDCMLYLVGCCRYGILIFCQYPLPIVRLHSTLHDHIVLMSSLICFKLSSDCITSKLFCKITLHNVHLHVKSQFVETLTNNRASIL